MLFYGTPRILLKTRRWSDEVGIPTLERGNEKNEKILNSLSRYLYEDVAVFKNRQAELDLQAFPNGVWERGKVLS